jgi:hypothetical protein
LTADYFDSVHPLPEVRIFVFTCYRILFASTCFSLPLYSADLFMCRVTNSLFHALLFQRQGPFRLIWPRLYLKPLRLMIIRTEMMPKIRRGNESTNLLLRVLQWLIRPLFLQEIWNTSTSWHRK